MTTARPFDVVIFDLDGTLVDSLPDIAWSLNTTLTEAGFPALPVENIPSLVGDGATKLIERALPRSEDGRDLAPLVARYIAHYGKHLCVDSRLYPGVSELIDSLLSSGVGLAVVTNKPGAVARALLGALGILDRFAVVLGDGDGFPRKPDPAAARSVIARVPAATARTVIVGDGLPDIRMARAVPCASIAVAWGYVARAVLQAESPTFLANTVGDVAHALLP